MRTPSSASRLIQPGSPLTSATSAHSPERSSSNGNRPSFTGSSPSCCARFFRLIETESQYDSTVPRTRHLSRRNRLRNGRLSPKRKHPSPKRERGTHQDPSLTLRARILTLRARTTANGKVSRGFREFVGASWRDGSVLVAVLVLVLGLVATAQTAQGRDQEQQHRHAECQPPAHVCPPPLVGIVGPAAPPS